MKKYLDTLFKLTLQGSGAALGFLSLLLLAREISQAEFAIYSLLTTGSLLINSASSLGFLQYANVHVPGQNKKERSNYYSSIATIVLINSSIFSSVYLLTYKIDDIIICLVFMISSSVNFYTKSILTTEGKVNSAIFYQNMIVPIALIFCTLIFKFLGHVEIKYIILLMSIIILILNYVAISSFLCTINYAVLKSVFFYIKTSLLMMKTSLMQLSFRFIDILIMPFIGFELNEIAIYVVATKLNILFVFAQNFIITKYTANFSKLCKDKNFERVKEIYRSVRMYLIAYSVLIILPCFIFSDEIVHVFGDEYSKASELLRVLVIGAIFNNIAGPAGLLLNLNGMHKYNYKITATCFLLFVTLIFCLGGEFGLIGIAIANTTTVVARNIAAYLKVRGFLKYA